MVIALIEKAPLRVADKRLAATRNGALKTLW